MARGVIEAVRELVERVSAAIREGAVVDAYLAGGTATFLHMDRVNSPQASEARYSEDADIQFSRSLVLGDDVVVRYEDDDGEERLLALDRTYTIEIGLRHPDCFEDAEFLFASSNGRLRLYLLSAIDLAVTKAGRFQDHDQQDIQLLAKAGLLRSDVFRNRAIAALDYLATDPAMIEINIEEASELIERARPG